MSYEDKFVAFIDILGFKELVEASERGKGLSAEEIQEVLALLGTKKDTERFEQHGPTTCPGSPYIQKDLGFKITQASDCVLVSSEVSPAGVVNLISHCGGVVISLLMKGVMCRGYITKGSIFHNDDNFFGTGSNTAIIKEREVSAFSREADERGTPFVEVDPIVCNYVKSCDNECVKKMFNRQIKEAGETTVLFPFQHLSHSFAVCMHGKWFNPAEEKENVENVRKLIMILQNRIMSFVDPTNEDAVRKSKHYINALNVQLLNTYKVDRMIDMLS